MMPADAKPFLCRDCGTQLAVSSPEAIASNDGVEFIFSRGTVILRCPHCGKPARWRKLTVDGSLLPNS